MAKRNTLKVSEIEVQIKLMNGELDSLRKVLIKQHHEMSRGAIRAARQRMEEIMEITKKLNKELRNAMTAESSLRLVKQ